MILNDIYRKYLTALQAIYSKGEASRITEMIFEHHGGISKSDVIKEPMQIIQDALYNRLEVSLAELLKHKPVQYITEEAWFCNMKFRVSGSVLIPRPETEELVHEVLLYADKDMSILDIGTGSGCIPVVLKARLSGVKVTAIDTSSEALAIAAENAKANNTSIDLVKMDFLNEADREKLDSYDIIISNPPYITKAEMISLDKNVTSFEPHLALFVPDSDPIIFYRKIAEFGKGHLKKYGKIFMETHEDHAKAVAGHFQSEGYNARIKKDMFEKERVVIANR